MANIILPEVNILNEINDSATMLVEQNGEINRFNIADLDIGGGDVTIDLEDSNISKPNPVNADTLGGCSPEEYAKKNELEEFINNRINSPKAGFIYPLASSTVPEGFLLCDGAEYGREEYPELFAAIGTIYGEGDGSTTFNVPNLQTRVPVGAGEGYELGSIGGEATHTLTVDEMPKHTHSMVYYNSSGAYNWGYNYTNGKSTLSDGTPSNGGIYYTGGDQPHNNMQPYIVVNYIIATGRNTGVSISDIILGAQTLPLGIEYGGTGATNVEDARRNLEITPESIGAMSMELLWENASPNSEFATQGIPLNLVSGDKVFIEFNGGTVQAIITYGVGGPISFSEHYNGSFYHYYRYCSGDTTGGKLVFYEGYQETSSVSVNNSRLIPFRIYKIKGAF